MRMSKRVVLSVASLVLAGFLYGCSSGPENHTVIATGNLKPRTIQPKKNANPEQEKDTQSGTGM